MIIKEQIKREIAEKMVQMSDPGYTAEYMGEWFAVDTDSDGVLDAVMHKDSTAPWDPWHDEAVAVPIADLFITSDCDFDPTPPDELIGDMDPDNDPAYDQAYEEAVDLALIEIPETFDV